MKKALLATAILLASGFLLLQSQGPPAPVTTIQFQNAGSTIGNMRNFFTLNCSTGTNCSKSGNTITLTGSGGTGTVSTCAAAGNAYYSASGTTIVCDTGVTDNGAGTLTATTFSGNATGLTGTPNISIGTLTTSSSTQVTNLNASTLGGATFAAPGAIGGGTAGTGAFSGITNTGGYTMSGKLLFSPTAPTISSGFGSSPTVPNKNGTGAFTINVGTGGVATAGVIGVVAASTGWACNVNNLTAKLGHRADQTVQTASTTTTVSVENQTVSTGAAVAWTASDILQLNCFAF